MISNFFAKSFGLVTSPAKWGEIKFSRLFILTGKIGAVSSTLGLINYFKPVVKALEAPSTGPSEQEVAELLKKSNELATAYDKMHDEFQYRLERMNVRGWEGLLEAAGSGIIATSFHIANQEMEKCFMPPVPAQHEIDDSIDACKKFIKKRREHLEQAAELCSESELISYKMEKIYKKQNVIDLAKNEALLTVSRVNYLEQLQGKTIIIIKHQPKNQL